MGADRPDSEREVPTARADGRFLPPTAAQPHRVLLLVAHVRNRALLLEWFDEHPGYDVVDGLAGLDEQTTGRHGTERDEAPRTRPRRLVHLESEPVDIVLVDVAAFEVYDTWLGRRFDLERSLPLPCLLLASESTARRFFDPAVSRDRHALVDDVVTTPVDPALLDRRLRAYLGIREMAAELERRHDQLSLLAQVVRHDIANAATVVTGWGELLHDDVGPAGVEALERVLRGGQRITEIVENSRDLTMLIDAGHDLETEAVLLSPTLQMEVDAIRRVHGSTTKAVTVDFEPPRAVVEVVAGGMLPSVFANLLSNAVRHNDAERVEIVLDVDVGPSDVVVRVADNGPGIPDDQKEHVFEPATKRGDSPGDGLGLSLVKRLVESYGGRVWFEDGEGGGAVACVSLRRATSSGS
ncbi:ATP-binding protein [Salinigranum sp.]|uniref:ATP-binding response regulator n=1 Tax=Salinigranum sp. TaxID=1966351 RepID=UPI0035663CFA